ncbi:MAG: YjjI family glycine radical enzyme [Spirochaetaceae bacterium]|nr:YjjI family glycine radical enzyme [Spirochaetaceae bacterium]
MDPVLDTIRDTTLTYRQKVSALARLGEERSAPLRISPALQALRDAGIVCDLNEGPAPYRPRYILPDYAAYLRRGSAFLRVEPPKDLLEAIFALLGIYRHVPSITGYPVWIGDLDALLEPFVEADPAALGPDGELSPSADKAVRLFMEQIDRDNPDSFCHADLGPRSTAVGRAILRHQRGAGRAVPNLSLRYDPAVTPDAFAEAAAACALETAKPSFANHPRFEAEFAALGLAPYAIASCYNGLPIGGGSLTLVRLNLARLAGRALPAPTGAAADLGAFLAGPLAEAVAATLAYIDERCRFLLGESGFFASSFLASEGLVSRSRFTAMFGLVGLAELANALAGAAPGSADRFGRGGAADEIGQRVLAGIDRLVAAHRVPGLEAAGGRALLHAQVGIDSDSGVSPGCRVPIGEEPPLHEQLLRSAPLHAPFVAGAGDVFAFEPTAKSNPGQIVDAVKGFFASGGRYFSCYAADSDVVRVTGYLVKRSEVEKLRRGEAVANGATVLGKGAFDNLRVLDRAVRK